MEKKRTLNMFPLLLLHLSILVTQQSCSTELELFPQILRQFQDYDVAFHHDDSHLEEVEHLLRVTAKENQPVYLINYDRSQEISVVQSNWLLHIVLLEKSYRLGRYTFINDINSQNVVIVISKTTMSRKQQKGICETGDLHRTRAVFIFEWTDGRFSTCCYYCGKGRVGLKSVHEENNPVPELKKYFNNFRNLHGHTFKIGYSEYVPFFYKFKPEQGSFDGPEWAILTVASKLLNFNFILIEYKENSTYSSKDYLIERVCIEEIDWAVGGISQTLMRTNMKNLRYTRYIQFQCYIVAYDVKEDKRMFGTFLVEFWYVSNWRSLLLILAGVTGMALVLKLSLKLSGRASSSLGEYAVMSVLYLVEQQSTKLKISARQWKPYIKLLFVFWLFTCLYLLANYKSVQAYFLMTSRTGPNNMEDLIKKGFEIQIETDDFFNLKRHCQYSTSKSCTRLLEKLEVFKSDVCGPLRNVLSDRIALTREEESLKHAMLRLCNLTSSQKQNLRFVSATVIPNEWHAWPFKKTASYIRAFSRIISRMESSGLLRYWYTKDTVVYNNYLNSKTQFRRENRPLNVSDFFYPFSILIVGYIVSTAVLLKELKSKPSGK